MKKQVSEGSLHKWFKGSKSKDGKGGWVNVVTGGTCASDEPGEGTPKCVSSSKRASMTKAERLSAARRKKKADPGQQQKSGAAKPTYVSTDKKKKKMKESYTRALTPLSEKAQKCWKGYEKKGTKKMFGKTYNNCVKKEEVEIVDEAMSSYDKARKAAAKRAADRNAERKAGKRGGRMERETYRSEGGVEMHHKGYRAEEVILERQKTNQGERQSEEQHQSTYGKATVRNKRKFGFSGGQAINAPKHLQRGTLIDKRREEHKEKRGVKTKGVKEEVDASVSENFYKKKYDVKKGGYVKTDKMDKSNKRSGDSKAQYREVHKDLAKEAYSANPKQQAAIAISKKDRLEKMLVAKKKKKQNVYSEDIQQEGAIGDFAIDKINQASEYMQKSNNPVVKTLRKVFKVKGGTNTPTQKEYQDKVNTQTNSYEPESETIEEGDKKGKGSGSKDACYHKVKSRYSVWPSAYASGALVKCRKVGAANWGNSSKKEDFSDWKAEFIWEDGDSVKKIEEKIQPGVKGDGFLGPTVGGLGIPNPIRITKDVVDTVNRKTQKTVDTSNKILPNSAKMGKFKEFNPTVSSATTKLLGIKNSYEPEGEELDEESPAWQRKEGKSESGGLNKKGVASYRAANPGSKLKTAVTTKPSKLKRGSKSAKRRKSFCSRMKGMKKKLTSAKTARDPDSRINKALRKWNC